MHSRYANTRKVPFRRHAGLSLLEAADAGDASVTIEASAGTLSGNVKKGDIFVLGGQNYVATADAEIDSDSIIVNIYPAIKENVAAESEVTMIRRSYGEFGVP